MFSGGFSLIHWLVLGVIILLLFGKGRFSDMMGDVAKGIKSFKKGMTEDEEAEAERKLELQRRLEASPRPEHSPEAPRLLALAAQDVGHVRRRLEMPAPAAFDEVDAAACIILPEPCEGGGDIDAEADMLADVRDAERLGGGEQGRFDRADGVVRLDHAARM